MSEFQPKDYWKIYLNKESKERIREIQDHLDDNYDGKSDFVQNKLQEEKPVSLEERIKKAKEKKQREEERLEKLKQVKKEREDQQTLKDKKELLRKKQEQFDDLENFEPFSEQKIIHETARNIKKSVNNSGESLHESEIAQDQISKRIGKKLDQRTDPSQLVREIERLQEEVSDLNGGREDWFLDVQSVEVTQ